AEGDGVGGGADVGGDEAEEERVALVGGTSRIADDDEEAVRIGDAGARDGDGQGGPDRALDEDGVAPLARALKRPRRVQRGGDVGRERRVLVEAGGAGADEGAALVDDVDG